MLELVAKYAVDQGLTVEPGFTTKSVKWLISLDGNGGFVGVQELGDAQNKRNQGLAVSACPEFPGNEMLPGGKAHPLVESLNVITLMPAKPGESVGDKDQTKHSFFVSLLDDLGNKVPSAMIGAKAVRDSSICNEIVAALEDAKAKPTDKATLAVGEEWLVSLPESGQWWRDRRAGQTGAEGSALCLISGNPTAPLMTHPKISGLGGVGGQAIGSSLISFDKGAFASYGFDQSENACVSEAAAMQYRAGLNDLISKGRKLGPMIVGHWYSRTVPADDDVPSWLIELPDASDEADARTRANQLLQVNRNRERPDLANCRYYSFSISWAACRVMLRDWQEGSFERLVGNVGRWFDDVAIVSSDGGKVIRSPKFSTVLGTTVRSENGIPKLDDAHPPMTAALWRSAITGSALPENASTAALLRSRIDAIGNVFRPDRMGLLKAYLIRNTEQGIHMSTHLNPEHPDPAYHAGRLMAVLANIQEAALGNVNANVVQRFYPAASATPALVFGRLARLSQFHLAKLDAGLAKHLDLKQAEIWGQIKDRLPTTFNLEQQTLFALGYYQQLAHDAAERRERSAAKKAAATDSNLFEGDPA